MMKVAKILWTVDFLVCSLNISSIPGKEVQFCPDEEFEMDSFLVTISEEVGSSDAPVQSSAPPPQVPPKKIIKVFTHMFTT